MSGLPLIFEPNQGQGHLDSADPRVKFLARGANYGLFFGADGAVLTLRSAASQPRSTARTHKLAQPQVRSLQMKLAHSNPNASLTAADPLPGKTNYLIGNDPSRWRRGIPQFARLRYNDVYPGINLVFYGNQGRLEYDFQIAPGADPDQAELEFDGAKQLTLQDGALVIQTGASTVRFEAPRVYQQIAGHQELIEGKFVVRGRNRAGFAVGPYDRSRELVIDPVLGFSTFFGGSGDEHSTFVAVDAGGKIYLAGSTTSADLITSHSPGSTTVFQETLKGAQNVYITRIDPVAQPPVIDYITYLGGSGIDSPVGIAVDAALEPMVAGTTTSPNFPVSQTNAYQAAPEAGSAGPHHVFATRLDVNAQVLNYSTYLSGNGDDVASGMTIDNNQDLFVTGTTTSNDAGTVAVQFPASSFPNTPAFQPAPVAVKQFFVTEVNTTSFGPGSIPYSTYFGGGATASSTTAIIANGGGIAVDTNGNIYFDGTTNFIFSGNSPFDFPIKNAYQPCLDQPPPAQIINPPTCSNSPAPTFPDGFLAKLTLNPAQGSQLQWSTYIGGAQTDSANGIALDTGAANVYVVGTTNSQVFTIPTTIVPFQRCLNNLPPTPANGIVTCTTQTDPAPTDAFIARFNNPASTTTNTTFNLALTYFSYLGGSTAGGGTGNDEGLAITVDTAADAVVTGFTQSKDFPIFPSPNDGIQNTLNGPQDAFFARINTATQTGQNTNSSFATYFGGSGTDQGTAITLDPNQNAYFAGDTDSTAASFRVFTPVQGNNNGGFDAFVTKFGTAATLALSGQLQLGTNQVFISAGTPAQFVYTITNNGPDLANNITVTDTFTGTGVSVGSASASATNNGTCSQGSGSEVCTIPQLQSASTATVTVTLTPAATAAGTSQAFNGGIVQASAANGVGSNQVTVTGQMSDYTISVNPNSFSVLQAGDTASYTVTLIPHPVYGSSITLSCPGFTVPAAKCVANPSSVSLSNSSSGTSTVSISTTVRPIITPAASLFKRRFYAVWLAFPALALLGVGTQKRRRRLFAIMAFCALLLLIMLQPACSHGTVQVPSSGTPAGTYTVTIAATAGSDTKSTTVTLVVP